MLYILSYFGVFLVELVIIGAVYSLFVVITTLRKHKKLDKTIPTFTEDDVFTTDMQLA